MIGGRTKTLMAQDTASEEERRGNSTQEKEWKFEST